MSIADFYTILFVVYRSEWTTDEENNPCANETEVGSFYGHIQQAQAELTENLGMSLTTAYSVWCPLTTDIKAGDTIESVYGSYSVKAIQRNENGENKHIQAIVQFDGVPRGS